MSLFSPILHKDHSKQLQVSFLLLRQEKREGRAAGETASDWVITRLTTGTLNLGCFPPPPKVPGSGFRDFQK